MENNDPDREQTRFAGDQKNLDVIQYICYCTRYMRKFGAVHLNKVLWFADALHYGLTGKAITSFRYVKQVNGPTPEPRQFLEARDALVRAQRLEIETYPWFGKEIRKHVSHTPVKEDSLEVTEREMLDRIIAGLCCMRATEVSTLSHHEMWWEHTAAREEIPLSAYFLSERAPKAQEIAYMKTLVGI